MRSPFLLAFGLSSVVAAAGLAAVPAHAQNTIFVPCSGTNGGAAGLVAAINQIGSSSGLIQLAAGCTYTFTSPAENLTALPVITGRIEIEGDDSVIARAANVPGFRIAAVAPGGYLSLTGITVRGGLSDIGAGIFNSGTLSLKFSKVIDNEATGSGGGIVGLPGSLTLLYRSAVSDNFAAANAAGIGIATGTLRAVNSLISGNTAVGEGGGIAVENGSVKLTDTAVTGNRAGAGAGIITAGTAHLQVEKGSKITYNVARRLGGGLFISGRTAEITKSLVAHNVAGVSGGGIYNTTSVSLANATVANNNPDNCGGSSPVPGCGNTPARVKEASAATGKSGAKSAGKHHGKKFHLVPGNIGQQVKHKR